MGIEVKSTPDDNGNSERLADDLLFGANAIAQELGLPVRKIYYWLEQGQLPARKLGELWVASKSKLRGALVGD